MLSIKAVDPSKYALNLMSALFTDEELGSSCYSLIPPSWVPLPGRNLNVCPPPIFKSTHAHSDTRSDRLTQTDTQCLSLKWLLKLALDVITDSGVLDMQFGGAIPSIIERLIERPKCSFLHLFWDNIYLDGNGNNNISIYKHVQGTDTMHSFSSWASHLSTMVEVLYAGFVFCKYRFVYHSLAPIAKHQRVNVWNIIRNINPKDTVEIDVLKTLCTDMMHCVSLSSGHPTLSHTLYRAPEPS